MVPLNHIRRGQGRPLILVHGLGGTWRTWNPILDQLASVREAIAIDLPGFGATPPLSESTTLRTLGAALGQFLQDQKLEGADLAGISMGGRLVLEMARTNGIVGSVVALAPGGFRTGRHRHAFYLSMLAAIRFLRRFRPLLPRLTQSALGRRLLLWPLSARPAETSPQTALDELEGLLAARSFKSLLFNLTYRTSPPPAPAPVSAKRISIGWGRNDRICLPRYAESARLAFPEAVFRWFDQAGHFPHWDSPEQTVDFILRQTD